MKEDIKFPEDIEISDTCKQFIWDLLNKNPQERLGSNGYEEVMQHEYF